MLVKECDWSSISLT